MEPFPLCHLPTLNCYSLRWIFPPATRQQNAERATYSALRRLAHEMQLPEPPNKQLRQVQLMQGALVAILGVPRSQARQWLQGSGCGGVYLRPFWTDRTAKEVDRSQFSLLWARGQRDAGAKLWEQVKDIPGVYGLLPSGRDIVVRIAPDVNASTLQSLQAKLRFVLNEESAQFRRPVIGQSW